MSFDVKQLLITTTDVNYGLPTSYKKVKSQVDRCVDSICQAFGEILVYNPTNKNKSLVIISGKAIHETKVRGAASKTDVPRDYDISEKNIKVLKEISNELKEIVNKDNNYEELCNSISKEIEKLLLKIDNNEPIVIPNSNEIAIYTFMDIYNLIKTQNRNLNSEQKLTIICEKLSKLQ